ncbi:MAG: hypothetical protein ACYTAF_08710, partial [Planctomycetota bacterium]
EARERYGAAFKAGRAFLQTAFLTDQAAGVLQSLEAWASEHADEIPKEELDEFQVMMRAWEFADERGLRTWKTVEESRKK